MKISVINGIVTHLNSLSPSSYSKQTTTVMSEQKGKKSRLAAAAEALIEAASLEADSFTNKKLAENLESLKTSFDGNLNEVVQKLDSSNENFDAKINALTQHVAGVKSELNALKSLMMEEYKQTQLHRALSLVNSGSFKYNCNQDSPYYGYTQKDSSELAKSIITSFMSGYGYYLPDNACMEQRPNNAEDGKKIFRDKLCKQIKDLIHREPRLVLDSKRWIIYYS